MQGASGMEQWNYLQLAAAFGTLISLTTLFLTVFCRRIDSHTRLKIEFWLHRRGTDMPSLRFRVVNSSRNTVYVDSAYLEYGTNQRIRIGAVAGAQRGLSLAPRFPLDFEYSMETLVERLWEQGYNGTVDLTFVVYDGTGAGHEKPLVVSGIERWRTTIDGPDPTKPHIAWYRRLFRSIGSLFRFLCGG
jgi:hypothetical protein